MDKQIYTYKEMQDRLPDYCFGNLEQEERDIFENSISLYEDLQKEIEDINNAFFGNIKEEYNDLMARKARNLSVKVNESLNKKETKRYYGLLKYLVPALGVLLLFAIIWQPDDEKSGTGIANVINEQDINEIMNTVDSPSELLAMINENTSTSNIEIDNNFDDIGVDIDDVYDDMVIDEFFANIDSSIDELSGTQLTEDDLFSIFNELDNEDFEQLLKEFKNVKIIS